MVVCKFYQTGSCRFGDRCRFEHIDRVNYPSNNNQRYPEQYVNRFPGSNYINNQAATAAAVVTGTGSGYNQRGSMVPLKKPDQYHYVASVYDRQFQPGGGQSYNHQSRSNHTGHSGSGGAVNSNNGLSGPVHQNHHHPHQQHGIMPVQYWQVQQQPQQQRHHQMQPTSSHHHHQSHSNNQRQAQVAHHGQGQSGGQHHPSGSGVQHHQQSSGFSFNQKLKEIETGQKPPIGYSFNQALRQIQQPQYQPHLAQQAQNQYYLTPTPMLTVPVQTPYYGVTMPMPMAPNHLAPMFPSMMPTNNADPKMISSYLPQQQPTQGKISMNISDDDSGIYSVMSSLTPEELSQYKADKFTFPHIPINPPPKELCL